MQYPRNEAEFLLDLERLNTMFTDMMGLSPHRARNKHNDEFDNPIEVGETYYSNATGNNRISRKSMEAMLYCLVVNNGSFTQRADQIIESKKELLSAAVKAVEKLGTTND